jgi:hypothetical protein
MGDSEDDSAEMLYDLEFLEAFNAAEEEEEEEDKNDQGWHVKRVPDATSEYELIEGLATYTLLSIMVIKYLHVTKGISQHELFNGDTQTL